jgi:biopolymer transport protein TolQ
MKNLLFTVLPGSIGNSGDIISLIKGATPIGKITLLILLIFSIISWAIIIFKLSEYSKAKKNSLKFVEYFRKSKNLSDINKFASTFRNNPLSEIFKLGYRELSLRMGTKENPGNLNLEIVQRSLLRASNGEITRLERLNGFLATTATVSPFIGLFGTVWGIMSSFQEISNMGQANLATVGPGIAEALIATALGLFAAIPAVIFYNLLLNKLKVIIASMEDFTLEFLNISENLK